MRLLCKSCEAQHEIDPRSAEETCPRCGGTLKPLPGQNWETVREIMRYRPPSAAPELIRVLAQEGYERAADLVRCAEQLEDAQAQLLLVIAMCRDLGADDAATQMLQLERDMGDVVDGIKMVFRLVASQLRDLK